MSRDSAAERSTAIWLLSMFKAQIAEFEKTGAHADRIEGLREGHATWLQRVTDLGGKADE